MENDVMISVSGLRKTFRLPHEQYTGAKQLFVNFFNQKRGYEEQTVFSDISFEIKKGEFFGIVGRNGSGKSTLLKLLAGIYVPDEGAIHVNGSLTPFIELGVGFNHELTGRENVYMNGALLGFSRKEMETMYDDIVEFAELEKFMDQKLKNYSSGMQVRLAFSIAIRAKSDILLIDEVLAVGDAAFQQKCFKYFERLKREKRTIVLVTHDMEAVKRFCTSALMLEQGEITAIGSPAKVANHYTLGNIDRKGATDDKAIVGQLKSLDVVAKSGDDLTPSDPFIFEVTYELSEDTPVYLGYSVMFHGLSIIEHNSREQRLPSTPNRKHTVTYRLPLQYFNSARFSINVSIFKEDNSELLGYKVDACEFFVQKPVEDRTRGGAINPLGTWTKNQQ